MNRTIVITGTDTNAGKTRLTALLAEHLRASGVAVAALKPICSGGRDDARVLRKAIAGRLTLNEINPWHFRAALAPLVAARRERREVTLKEVVAHVHRIALRFSIVLVEGAGGLLSPLGEGFSTRELIGGLNAEVIVAAPNQLGVVNHLRLTMEALPPIVAARARVVLMSPANSNAASRSNPDLVQEFIPREHVHVLPFLNAGPPTPSIRRTLQELLR